LDRLILRICAVNPCSGSFGFTLDFQQILAEKRLRDKVIVDSDGAIRLPQCCRCVSSRKLRMRILPGKSSRSEREGAVAVYAPDRILNKTDKKRGGNFPLLIGCGYQELKRQPRNILLLLALFIKMVESTNSPQHVHFHASKDLTKS
jgi:hypothetical protein